MADVQVVVHEEILLRILLQRVLSIEVRADVLLAALNRPINSARALLFSTVRFRRQPGKLR